MKGFFDPDLFARTYRDPLAWLSLGVDLLPIAAVVLFGWKAVPLVALYWLENLVIGGFTILRMIGTVANNIANIGLVLFLAPFFTVHYGFFVAIQGMLLFAFLLNGYEDATLQSGNLLEISRFFLTKSHVQLGLGTIGIGHLMYYFQKSLLERAYEKGAVLLEFIGPYKRIIIQQLLVILGAPLVLASGGPIGALALLVVLKGGFDLLAYRQKDPWFWLRSKKEPAKSP